MYLCSVNYFAQINYTQYHMKKTTLFLGFILSYSIAHAGIDMQAHVASDEGLQAYTDYQTKQIDYYEGECSPANLMATTGDDLFELLNTLMGETSKIGSSSYSYNSLRSNYVKVDKDLNNTSNIIGYYDGRSMNGTWDSGKTWNREHTWPQSKGAKDSTPMGHDMQSVRPASTSVNSSRGNQAYGEYEYDPDEVDINNKDYNKINLGSYRGDAARVILYDYIVYAQAGGHKNSLYNSECTLSKLKSSSGVFESLTTLLKWHMQDPPSLTEMVRNDGAQNYQGNRNPFIDYPELAIQVLKNDNSLTVRKVSYVGSTNVSPRYNYTTPAGFICYLGTPDNHPEQSDISVSGASFTYNATLGRLTITNVTKDMTISIDGTTGFEASTTLPKVQKAMINGRIVIVKDNAQFDVLGRKL